MTLPATLRLLLCALLLPVLGLLGGCGTNPLKGSFTNRLVVTVAEDECMAASRWGPVALTGDVDARDCQVLVQAMRLRALMLNAAAMRGATTTD